jgi:diguanylate cyclase (GGDEF)-like protein
VGCWLVLIGGVVAVLRVPGHGGHASDVPQNLLMTIELLLFGLFLLRLLAAAVAWPARRLRSLMLGLALVLYSTGSSLTTSADPHHVHFPSAGDTFFIGTYVLLFIFLALDSKYQEPLALSLSAETMAIVNAGICAAGAALFAPASSRLQEAGPGVLTTLLYPFLDLVLGSIVLANVVLGRRGWSRQALALISGFTLMAVADSRFAWDLASGGAQFGPTLTACWGVALTLIVAGACGPVEDDQITVTPQPSVIPLLVAATVAVVTLIFTPSQLQTIYQVAPAVLTLTAVLTRLTLSLREARGAAEAYRLSLTDDLTGLPNRRALLARIQEGDGSGMALLLLDLDGFKDVNDTLGHAAGDHVLRLVSRRLRVMAYRLRPQPGSEPLVARLGGDEFAILLSTNDEAEVLRAAEKIRLATAEALEVHGHTFIMASSVGISTSDGVQDRSDLLRQADVAMYQAKTTKAGALIYDPERDEFTTERLKTAEYLRLGIPSGQLRAWYQPQVDAVTRRLVGLEALVRWEHPELGVQPPAAFLSVARQSGLMPLLTETVLQLLLEDIRRWRTQGFGPQVSFNIAPPELLNAALLARLLARIDAAKVPPGTLILEVTEDSLLADPQRARDALTEIRRHQVQVSIDDYGTGFSSLSYLRNLPVDELKLDQSFIRVLQEDQRTRIIVASTNQMAQGLGLRTVAEGVEDSAIAATVQSMGINLLQGYFIARPMPADDVLIWRDQWEADLTDAEDSPATAAAVPSS